MASGHVDERIPEETDSMMTTHEYTITNGFVLPNQREPLSQILSRNFKMLLPFRKIEKNDREFPSEKVGCCSFITVHWLTKIMQKANREGLENQDIYQLPPQDQARFNAERLQRLWESEQELAAANNRKPSLFNCIVRFGRTRFLVSGIFLVISMILQFLAPSVVLKLILDFLSDPLAPVWWGWTLVSILAIGLFSRAFFFGIHFMISHTVAARMMGASQYLGFSKLLRLASPNDAAMGLLVTFCTGDQERIAEAANSALLLISTPVMFILSTAYLWFLIGPYSLIGCFIILMFYPIMGGLSSLTTLLRTKVVSISDKRVTLMNEIIGSIKLIKMYAWEKSFQSRVLELRHQERQRLQKAAMLHSLSTAFTPTVTILAAIVTIIALTLVDFPLTAPIAFTVVSIFSALQFTLGTMTFTLKSITEAKVGFDRLQSLLEMPEHENISDLNPMGESSKVRISIKKANFLWEKAKLKNSPDSKGKKDYGKKPSEIEPLVQNATLIDVNLAVEEGQMLGVAGPVGSGKSSLLSAILGEMAIRDGSLKVQGPIAVVPQQAWIFNGTVKANIIFGMEFSQEKFDKVIDICALKPDLDSWPLKEKTKVGDKGVSLSGGQKQRINLARAIYSADTTQVFLLDDPLSAVDPRVAKEVFEKCIDGFLRALGKTVILVNHNYQFLQKCDNVIFMLNGTIAELGSFNDLISADTEFKKLLSYDHQSNGIPETKEPDREKGRVRMRSVSHDQKTPIFASDENKHSKTGWKFLGIYLQSLGKCYVGPGLFIAILLLSLSRLFTYIWLQIWLDVGDGLVDLRRANASLSNVTLTDEELRGLVTDNDDLWLYQVVYGLSYVLLLLFGIIKAVSMAVTLLDGSCRLHDRMLKSVLQAPMDFFDSTPTGQLINRFSKDMDELDVRIPLSTEFVMTSILFCVTQTILICFIYPELLAALATITIVCIVVDKYMTSGVTHSKRLENETKSAIVQDISSMFPGIPVIRAFGRQHVVQHKFDRDVNRNLSAQTLFRFSNRWFALRMDLLSVLCIVATAAMAIIFRGDASSAESGIALSNVFPVATFVPFLLSFTTEFKARLNSVERVWRYATKLPQEIKLKSKRDSPPKGWPTTGTISFKNVSLRYNPTHPLVLKSLSFDVKSGEKIGIVGRTGAGKSSLLTSIMRFCELSTGQIFVDYTDIATIDLDTLRASIAVIPQDPVLFQGTLRFNLDPFNQYPDDKLWLALEKAHLKNQIKDGKNEAGLEMNVETEGDNFSVGEKQLICLARALLRENKILFLDEATASVDMKTDYLIQSTIQEAFANCTVLTVAHRINTIINYDRVIVMENGQIVEIGQPEVLLQDTNGYFYSMVAASGITI